MTATLDLNALPILRQGGQEQPHLPGLYMVTPPRQATRSRTQDKLILYLTMSGNYPLAQQQEEQILIQLAQTYFKTAGSTTSALKTTAESLNQILLERNLRSSNSGKQGIGVLCMATLREDRLTLALCGPSHVYLINQEEGQDLFDPQGAGRGLGFTRSISIRFYQLELHHNDLMILTLQPPPGWRAQSLKQSPNQNMDSLRRHFISQAGPELNAVIFQAQVGTGKLRTLKPKPPVQMAQPAPGAHLSVEERSDANSSIKPSAAEISPEEILAAYPPAEIQTSSPASQPPETPSFEPALAASIPTNDTQPPTDTPVKATRRRPEAASKPAKSKKERKLFPGITRLFSFRKKTQAAPGVAEKTTAGEPAPVEATFTLRSEPTQETAPSAQPGITPDVTKDALPFTPLQSGAGKVLQGTGRAARKALHGLAVLLKHVLPDESLFTIPSTTMIFTAIAVASTIATIGALVYFDKGRSALYQSYYDQAKKAADQALAQSDPVEIRTGWETVMDYLSRADFYGRDRPESIALRSQAQAALDQMDGIIRLDYKPILASGLGSSAQITRIVASERDVYLLNANGGSVMRLALTGTGYDIDPDFRCGPNQLVGALVDIITIPKGAGIDAAVMGVDGSGNLLLCQPGEAPNAIQPAPPQTGWGSPIALQYDSGDLYILDPKTNAVWIYRDLEFDLQPHLFFGEQIPAMADVIDLTVNREDLYLLHSDGHLTTCQYSGLAESPTRCDDPATYVDTRSGRQNGPIILDARFSQILYTQPPDPSIYMLDPVHQSVYHFSLRLTLQRQFRDQGIFSTSDSATAFTITANRLVFLAVGDQIYSARMP